MNLYEDCVPWNVNKPLKIGKLEFIKEGENVQKITEINM